MKGWIAAVCTASVLLVGQGGGQEQTWRVFLRDKGPEPFRVGSALYERTKALHTPRALLRRAKVRSADSLLSLEDAPLYQPYLDSIRRWGTILLALRWHNYVVVRADSLAIAELRRYPFVAAVQPTWQVPLLQPLPVVCEPEKRGAERVLATDCGRFDYGPSWRQVQMLSVPALHRMGLGGDSVLLGVLDTGFRWRQHPALGHLRVLAEWDFLGGDSLTANEVGDAPSQDSHGTLVLSILGGFWQGQLIGVAPRASYVLAKTEDIARERHLEEDAYAAAVEWMEALGVEVISSSLGYRDFDSGEVSYGREQLDGQTTIVARALRAAAERGVLCVTAMGNMGAGGIVSPADADSALAVAAVDTLGRRLAFSSVGFRRGELVRPSLAALGSGVVAVGAGGGGPVRISGTSAATPLVAGVVALLLQARPDVPPWRLRRALLQTASQGMAPDTLVGYGIPNPVRALLELGGAVGPPALLPVEGSVRVIASALLPFCCFQAQLQWARAPREDAVQGSFALRMVGEFLCADIPPGLLQGRDTVWLRIVVVSSSGQHIASRWYAVGQLPAVPCGMEIPEELLRGAAAGGAAPVVVPSPVVRGQEWSARFPAVHPAGGQPLRSVRLWDMTGRLVMEHTMPPEAGVEGAEWTVRLPAQGLASGFYWLEGVYGEGGLQRLQAAVVVY